MDDLINFLKSNKKIEELKLKEIREILISIPMYEWYIDNEGNESLEEYFKMLELLGKIYYLEELVSIKCNHIFFFNNDENKYQCVRCGCRRKKDLLLNHVVRNDDIDYYKACRLYDSIDKFSLAEMSNEEITLKIFQISNKFKGY